MTVLVVRPSPSCDELVNDLKKIKINAIPAPFLHFADGKDLNDFPKYMHTLPVQSILVAVSPRAIEYASRRLADEKTQWRKDLIYIAVGETTATLWQKMSHIAPLLPKTHDSEGLYQLITEKFKLNQTVTILRGNGGREFLAQHLCKDRFNLCYVELYQRRWDHQKVAALLPDWQHQNVDTIVISSGEQLTQLFQSLNNKGQLWLKQCQLFVPSKRVFNQALSLGFPFVNCVNSASNHHFFDALKNKRTWEKMDD